MIKHVKAFHVEKEHISFKWKDNLKTYVKPYGNNIKSMECSDIDDEKEQISFNWKNDLKTYVKPCQNKDKTIESSDCPATFMIKQKFQEHIETFPGESNQIFWKLK